MDRKKLLQIIDKNLNELLEINQEMSQNTHLSKLEIDIALAKAKLIFQEYEFLREINSPQTEKTAAKVEALIAAAKGPTLFDVPLITPVKIEAENHQPETIKNDLKEVDVLPQPLTEISQPTGNEEQEATEKAAIDENRQETFDKNEALEAKPIDIREEEKTELVEEPVKVELAAQSPAQTEEPENETLVEKLGAEETVKPVEKFELEEEKPTIPEPIEIKEAGGENATVLELLVSATSAAEEILDNDVLPKNGTAKAELQEKKTVTDQFQAKSLNDTISSNNKLDQRLASAPIQKLENSIGLNDRFQYIRELFNNDADLFRDTITKIDKMHTIDEALDFLDSQFEWEMDDISLKFIHLVRRRFSV